MNVRKIETAPAEDRDDLLPLLDEELNRLPQRFRAALVACELEGQSRRQAAAQLGLSEGTLSSHLARGRKLLRERLLRRGVSLGIGPGAGFRCPITIAVIPERLMSLTVQASLDFATGSGAAATAPAAASLAERVLKTMVLGKLSLVCSFVMAAATAAVCLGLIVAPAGGSVAQAKPAADDLSGRVVDDAGKAVADGQVWAVAGDWAGRVTVASAKTDGKGQFVLPKVWENEPAKAAVAAGKFGLFASGSDGRPGWLPVRGRLGAGGEENKFEITLSQVGEARGHLTDKNGKPIKDVFVTSLSFDRTGRSGAEESFILAEEAFAKYRDRTAADGSFVLKNIPRGARIRAAIEAPGAGWLHVLWDSSQPVTIVNRGRVGQIKGRVTLPEGGAFRGQISVAAYLAESPGDPRPGSYKAFFSEVVPVGEDGSFLLDELPTGRYHVVFQFDQKVPFAPEPVQDVDVAPDAVVTLGVNAARLWTITGRVVDAATGKGVAKVPVRCYRFRRQTYAPDPRGAETDAEGRYTIFTAPGLVKIVPGGVPGAHLVPRCSEAPDLQVMGDQAWPDLKLIRAVDLEGMVVDEKDQPVVGADVYVLESDRAGPGANDRVRTGPGGVFHFDQLDPEETVSLWARTRTATTDGVFRVRPGEILRKFTLTIDPSFACQIRGIATDASGKRLAGAHINLWWGRPYSVEPGGEHDQIDPALLESVVTGENGWFVFRGLWPGFQYGTELDAWGHSKAEAHTVIAKAGEIRDVGRIVLPSTAGRLAGRVVGSDGAPLSGAAVFNRGDGPEAVATVTDSQGQFQLGSLIPGTKYAFVRKDGYRFTGIKADDDAAGLLITMKKASEPPPEWKPGGRAGIDEQRAFAKQMLIRLWEKFGSDANDGWTFECIQLMAPIDMPLASDWSARTGHRYESVLHHLVAETMAETDAKRTVALLSKDQNLATQAFVQRLAQRFAVRDRAKASIFADEAIKRARVLPENELPPALAVAGTLLTRIGRGEEGRALIDEAAQAADQVGTDSRAAQARALVANLLAIRDFKRAMALLQPIQVEDTDRFYAFIARAIASSDTPQALALADDMNGPTAAQERVKTAIAYKIAADRPDEAIKIIEHMKRENAGRWQAEAFAWMAVPLAPQDRTRAFALIDRALAMLTNDPVTAALPVYAGDDQMLAAAHIAARARQIGYPDMESVVMRVMAARPAHLDGGPERQIRFTTLAMISLALVDPETAFFGLSQLETRLGSGRYNPAKLGGGRAPWLTAWALVDLKKAAKLFDDQLAAVEANENGDSLIQGFFNTAKVLASEPERREVALQEGLYGASWRPAQSFE